MFLCFFFSDFLYASICCGYSLELHRQEWVPTTYAFIKTKKCTGCNLKTTELFDCALIGLCAVIRSNTVVEVELPYGCISYMFTGSVIFAESAFGPKSIKFDDDDQQRDGTIRFAPYYPYYFLGNKREVL